VVIVGTETVPLLSGFVCPLLKVPEVGGGRNTRETVEQRFKLSHHGHRRLVISGHTVALDGLKKGCTDAVRVAIIILQIIIIILAGLEVIGNNGGSVVLEDV
jgi:hypothetical protein